MATDKLDNGRHAFRVTSTFAEHRAAKRGLGSDVGNYLGGDPVVAMAPGTVTYVEAKQGIVRIDHGGGWSSGSGHMAAISVKVGQKVARGQQIGKVGKVGTAELHLHFGIRFNGVEQDAWPLLEQNAIADEGLALSTCVVGAGNNLRKRASVTARAHFLSSARTFEVLEYQPAGGAWDLGTIQGHDWVHLRGEDPEGWWIARPLATNYRLTAAGRLLLPPADCSATEARIDRAIVALSGFNGPHNAEASAVAAAISSLKET